MPVMLAIVTWSSRALLRDATHVNMSDILRPMAQGDKALLRQRSCCLSGLQSRTVVISAYAGGG